MYGGNMEYIIQGINLVNGTLMVLYDNKYTEAVSIPIENGLFISGEALEAIIQANAPLAKKERDRLISRMPEEHLSSLMLKYVPPVPDMVPSTADIVRTLGMAVQVAYLDIVAQQYGYDNIMSACSYANVPGPFQEEAIKFATWRNNVWVSFYSIMEASDNGTRVRPTVPELLAELPEF